MSLIVCSVRRVCEGCNTPLGFIKDGTYIEYKSDHESYEKNSTDLVYFLS